MTYIIKAYNQFQMTHSFRLLIALLFLSQIQLNAQDLHTMESPLPCIDKTFTIVAHIARDSFGEANIAEADILASIDDLNKFYSPICADFEICEFNYIDNFQYDTLEADRDEWSEMLILYNRPKRINMYFVAVQEGNNLCGFASYNGVSLVDNVGILILKPCVGGAFKTIPHEMGHFFGLLHTFEGSPGSMPMNPEAVDGSNCDTAGDEVCDTPADPFVPGMNPTDFVDVEEGCRFVNRNRDPITNEYYVPDVGNLMSYYPDECRCGFTNGQFIRMVNNYYSAAEKLW